MQHNNTFGLTKVNKIVTLKSISSLKASKNIIPDAKLSFCKMSMVKNTFIPLMTKYQWSVKTINAFAQLFTQLELHPYCQREFGKQALITYQAQVRHEWHNQLKLGSAFNIGIINEDLLHGIYKELLNKAQLQGQCLLFYLLLWVPVDHLLVPFLVSPSLWSLDSFHHAPCTLQHASCTVTWTLMTYILSLMPWAANTAASCSWQPDCDRRPGLAAYPQKAGQRPVLLQKCQ